MTERQRTESFFRLIEHPRFWRAVGLLGILAVCYLLGTQPNFLPVVVRFGGGEQTIGLALWSCFCVMAGFLFADAGCARQLRLINESLKRQADELRQERTSRQLLEKKISVMRTALTESFLEWPEVSRSGARVILARLDEALSAAELAFRPRSEVPVPGGQRASDPQVQS